MSNSKMTLYTRVLHVTKLRASLAFDRSASFVVGEKSVSMFTNSFWNEFTSSISASCLRQRRVSGALSKIAS